MTISTPAHRGAPRRRSLRGSPNPWTVAAGYVHAARFASRMGTSGRTTMLLLTAPITPGIELGVLTSRCPRDPAQFHECPRRPVLHTAAQRFDGCRPGQRESSTTVGSAANLGESAGNTAAGVFRETKEGSIVRFSS